MSDEFQLRRDIDKLYRELYDSKTGVLILVPFKEGSSLKNIYNETDSKGNPTDQGTIDGILGHYGLLNLEERVSELENRIQQLEDNE